LLLLLFCENNIVGDDRETNSTECYHPFVNQLTAPKENPRRDSKYPGWSVVLPKNAPEYYIMPPKVHLVLVNTYDVCIE
jgi:hypothetical protein